MDYVPCGLTKEYRAELANKFESYDSMMVPISRLDGVALLRQVEMLEKEADWLAMELQKRVRGCEWCSEVVCSRHYSSCGYTGPDNWRKAARKAVGLKEK